MKCFIIVLLLLGGVASAQSSATGTESSPNCGLKDVSVHIKLLSPLGTTTARPGDAFTTAVQSPPQFTGGMIEGSVKKLVRAERGFGRGKPSIELEFTTLTFNNRTCHISGELMEVTNSKGVAKVDDEGRAVGHTSNKKRIGATVGGAMLGALAGAYAGGSSGAAVGAAAGAAAGFVLSSTMTTVGKDIQFEPGSIFTLQVSDRRGNVREH